MLIDGEGVVGGPLWLPGFLNVYVLMWEGGGDGVEVPHVVVDGFVFSCLGSGAGGLIDEPDFDGVVDGAVFVIGDADGDGCGLVDGEVAGVGFCFSGGSEEVEFGELFPGFGGDKYVD